MDAKIVDGSANPSLRLNHFHSFHTHSFFNLQVFNNPLYWNWLSTVFLPGVYAGAWYNRQQEKQSIYTGNKRSVRVGMPRLRQLRVKPSK